MSRFDDDEVERLASDLAYALDGVDDLYGGDWNAPYIDELKDAAKYLLDRYDITPKGETDDAPRKSYSNETWASAIVSAENRAVQRATVSAYNYADDEFIRAKEYTDKAVARIVAALNATAEQEREIAQHLRERGKDGDDHMLVSLAFEYAAWRAEHGAENGDDE